MDAIYGSTTTLNKGDISSNWLFITTIDSAKNERIEKRVKMPPPTGSRSGGLLCSTFEIHEFTCILSGALRDVQDVAELDV